MAMPLHDLTGHKFGMLTVLSRAENTIRGAVRWNCTCDCGQTHITCAGDLRNGQTRSCGCLRTKNGRKLWGLIDRSTIREKRSSLSTTFPREYNSWLSMIHRCTRPKDAKYHLYGARGISVCEQWKEFKNFLSDMGRRPEGKTLDRYPDKNGNYEPTNCRWAYLHEQSDNRRCTRFVELEDGRKVSLREFASMHHLSINQIRHHFTAGHNLLNCVRAMKGGQIPKARACHGVIKL